MMSVATMIIYLKNSMFNSRCSLYCFFITENKIVIKNKVINRNLA